MAVTPQDNFVFKVYPAPTAENKSLINWRAYLSSTLDEINIVDEKTNTLVSTIGASRKYKFANLPKSYTPQYETNPNVLGQAVDALGTGSLLNDNFYLKLNNGNIAYVDFSSNYFRNGIFIFDAFDEETIDSNNGYWLAFKPNDNDPNIFEKVAEIKMSDYYYFTGSQVTYNPVGQDNVCVYLDYLFPGGDNQAIFSKKMELTINENNGIYSLSYSEIDYNYGGATVLSLYNDNAPVPVAPGDALWNNRTPYISMQNDYVAMMNGVDEGWVWYGDANSATTLFTYQAGFNIITGETAFVEPISSLATTTNLNSVIPVSAVNFNFSNWESHPAGVWYGVYNGAVADMGDNTNGVTALYSPRWVNNTKVTFLTQRNPDNAQYISLNGAFSNNFSGAVNDLYTTFDNENCYFSYWALITFRGYLVVVSKSKLDSNVKETFNKVLPMTELPQLPSFYANDNDFSFFGSIRSGATVFPIAYSIYTNYYWEKDSEEIYTLQSNNYYTTHQIDNKFYSYWGALFYNKLKLGIEYDVYSQIPL